MVYPAILSGGIRRKLDHRAGGRSGPIFLELGSYNKLPDGVKSLNSCDKHVKINVRTSFWSVSTMSLLRGKTEQNVDSNSGTMSF
jgi:hypothetical protein